MSSTDKELALPHPLLRAIEEAIRKIWKKLGADTRQDITPEMMWCYLVYTDFLRSSFQPENSDGCARLLTADIRDPRLNPFASSILELHCSTTKVLVVAKRWEGRDIEAHVREQVLEYTSQAIGRSDLEIAYCFSAESFWPNFFGTPRYLSGEAKDIPVAIVSTGGLRAYTDTLPIDLDIGEFLLQIGKDWGTPIGLMHIDAAGKLTPKALP